MSVWFTADTHFGHGNIIKYCQRPFLTPAELEIVRTDPRGKLRLSDATVRRHDESLLDAINTRVDQNDTLWVLGDFCWGGLDEAMRYRAQVRCRNVHLVWGNHDQRAIRPVFREAIEQGMVQVEGQDIWLNHYPMRSWNRSFHGSWHFYGHVHGRLAGEDNHRPGTLVKDVGVDACDYRPWSFEELSDYMGPRIEAFQRRKSEFRGDASDPLV